MRNTLIFKKILALACVPAGTISMVPAFISQSSHSEEQGEIPKEWLNIDSQGVLTGFTPEVTLDAIRSGNYTTLKLPSDVKEIADYAFAYVFDNKSTNVTKLILNPKLEKIGRGAFLYCYGFNNAIEWNKLVNLKYIGDDAFNYCSNLSGVLDLPKKLEHIGKTAFKDCQGFTQIKIPTSLKFVGDYAFEKCTNVADVFFRNDDTKNQFIPDWFGTTSYAFTDLGDEIKPSGDEPVAKNIWIDKFTVSSDEWTRLLQSQLNLPKDFEVHGDKEIADETTLKIENGVCKGFITNDFDWTKYNLIRIPDGVTEIADNAFQAKIAHPDSRIYIEFDDDLTKIGNNAFDGCNAITGSINLPAGCSDIGERAFYACIRLTGTFIIPLEMKTIPKQMLEGCGHINKLIFQNLPEEIGLYAFATCIRLKEIDFSRITSFAKPQWNKDNKPFFQMGKPGTIYFPSTAQWEAVQENYTNKLRDCGLENVEDWVQTINMNCGKEFPYHPEQPIEGQSYYFSGNELVKMRDELAPGWDLDVKDYQIVRIPDKTLKIRKEAFKNKFKLPSSNDTPPLFQTNWNVKFNRNIQEIGENAFEGCDGIVGHLDFNHSLQKIGAHAFKDCKNLTSVKIYENTSTMGESVFEGCDNLQYIDLTNIKRIPVNWKYEGPFGLPESWNGLIFINQKMVDDQHDQWKTYLEWWQPNADVVDDGE